jgi:DNA-binding transcriptional regulator YiaG
MAGILQLARALQTAMLRHSDAEANVKLSGVALERATEELRLAQEKFDARINVSVERVRARQREK